MVQCMECSEVLVQPAGRSWSSVTERMWWPDLLGDCWMVILGPAPVEAVSGAGAGAGTGVAVIELRRGRRTLRRRVVVFILKIGTWVVVGSKEGEFIGR